MSAAIKSLAYRPYATPPEENKQGFVYYSGGANDYHYWNFKVELKLATTDEKDFPGTVTKMVESLRGDALAIAMDIGVAELTKIDRSGVQTLRDRMKNHVFPIIKDEVKSLYREGHR